MYKKENMPKLTTKVAFFALLVISTILCSCISEFEEDPLIGGCEYESDTGYVKFIGYGDTISEEKQAIFNFYSKKAIRIPFDQFYDTACLKTANLNSDTSYVAIRKRLIKGSCAGDVYEIKFILAQCTLAY